MSLAPKLRPRQYDLIVFDWDGTLFDSTALIVRCIQASCRDLNVDVPDDRRAAYTIGLGLVDVLRSLAPGLPRERYPELGTRYRHHYAASQHELSLFTGVVPLLHDLKNRNHWLAVATGKSRRGLDEAMRSAKLDGLFDATRTADETACKPDPCMLLELMREFGTSPERTLMIGDTTHDLQMAANAGTACVAVSYGAHEPEAFALHSPVAVIHTTAELHDWLVRYA